MPPPHFPNYKYARRFIRTFVDLFEHFHDVCLVWAFEVAEQRYQPRLAADFGHPVFLGYSFV